jgi:Leucine-rich repeat (LRR) protein
MSGNKINSIQPDTFLHTTKFEWLSLKGNSITDINSSTFRKNIELRHLDISRNKITVINADTFIHNKKLIQLSLQGYKITDISNSSFGGLEELEILDLSNNIIEELKPLVFHNTLLTSSNHKKYKVSKLKHVNLAHNMIRSFNFELYFPSSSNSDTFNPPFQLEYLNLSSNHLTTLDVTSVKWLTDTTAVTYLTANPWNCDCSVLLGVWRQLKHKHTLHCASPRELQGESWNVIEGFCSEVLNNKKGGHSVITTTLIVSGVVLVCAIGGGLILTKEVKRRRKRPKSLENRVVYLPSASYVSDHSYKEVDSGPTHDRLENYADVGKRPSFISVQS